MGHSISGLKAFKSPVILREGNREEEYGNGTEASEASYEIPMTVAGVTAGDFKIVVYIVENKRSLTADWTDHPVDLFDED